VILSGSPRLESSIARISSLVEEFVDMLSLIQALSATSQL